MRMFTSRLFPFKVESNGCGIHILALAVLLGYRWIFLIHKIIVEIFENRRKGVASLLLEQVLSRSQLPITVEVQVRSTINVFKYAINISTANETDLILLEVG